MFHCQSNGFMHKYLSVFRFRARTMSVEPLRRTGSEYASIKLSYMRNYITIALKVTDGFTKAEKYDAQCYEFAFYYSCYFFLIFY